MTLTLVLSGRVQTFACQALLRLPRGMSKEDKLKQVHYVIDMLGLKKCMNTKIGNVLSRGISGGERKRTSIASELLTNPSVLLLDEPTSGTDVVPPALLPHHHHHRQRVLH